MYTDDLVSVREAPRKLIEHAKAFLRETLKMGVECVGSSLYLGLAEVYVTADDGKMYVAQGYCGPRSVRTWKCIEK